MLGALYTFFFTFIVVIMRHVEPKANETVVENIKNNKNRAVTNASRMDPRKKDFNWAPHCGKEPE